VRTNQFYFNSNLAMLTMTVKNWGHISQKMLHSPTVACSAAFSAGVGKLGLHVCVRFRLCVVPDHIGGPEPFHSMALFSPSVAACFGKRWLGRTALQQNFGNHASPVVGVI
jgi:hypothetical protein